MSPPASLRAPFAYEGFRLKADAERRAPATALSPN